MAQEYGVRLLGELPLDAHIREEADGGRPTWSQLPNRRAPGRTSRWRGHGRSAGGARPRPQQCVSEDRGRRDLILNSWTPMSIKSDNWIRRMAREHAMIEPFAAEQVREANGRKIVSYGTSSYGYDVRCASEFKIFTNINSTIVDPKNFDEKSFVDFRGDVCIIPPNSFALARTVEYFRIPRNVLVVTLGKARTRAAGA